MSANETKMAASVVDLWTAFSTAGVPVNRTSHYAPLAEAESAQNVVYELRTPSDFGSVRSARDEQCDWWHSVWGFSSQVPVAGGTNTGFWFVSTDLAWNIKEEGPGFSC